VRYAGLRAPHRLALLRALIDGALAAGGHGGGGGGGGGHGPKQNAAAGRVIAGELDALSAGSIRRLRSSC